MALRLNATILGFIGPSTWEPAFPTLSLRTFASLGYLHWEGSIGVSFGAI